MSYKVLKLNFDVTNPVLLLNEGAEILTGTFEREQAVIYVMADESKPKKERLFKVLPTNMPVQEIIGWQYKLTFYSSSGFAWHLFEL